MQNSAELSLFEQTEGGLEGEIKLRMNVGGFSGHFSNILRPKTNLYCRVE